MNLTKTFLMNDLYVEIAKMGGLGLVLAWSLWRNEKLTDRLFSVIENNTKVMQGINKTIDNNSIAAIS